MEKQSPLFTVGEFNAAINAQDLEALVALMSPEHQLVDFASNVVRGKENCAKAWAGFFAAFPDYQNHVENEIEDGSRAILIGYSTCSNEAALEGPAIWTARVDDGFVREWRVYEDTPEVRRELEIER